MCVFFFFPTHKNLKLIGPIRRRITIPGFTDFSHHRGFRQFYGNHNPYLRCAVQAIVSENNDEKILSRGHVKKLYSTTIGT